jgi:hypothetical protein
MRVKYRCSVCVVEGLVLVPPHRRAIHFDVWFQIMLTRVAHQHLGQSPSCVAAIQAATNDNAGIEVLYPLEGQTDEHIEDMPWPPEDEFQ